MRLAHRRPALLALTLTAIALIAATLAAPAAAQAPLLTIATVEFAHGDAAIYRAACGEQALIDAGAGATEEVLDQLDAFGDRTLDVITATHMDRDHIGALADIATTPGVTVGTWIDGVLGPDDHDSATFDDYYAVSRAGNQRTVDIGDTFTLCAATANPVTFEVLAVGYDGTTVAGLPVSGANDLGIVYRVTVGGTTVTATGRPFTALAAGDINGTDGGGRADVEGALVATYGDSLRSQFMKVIHHGSLFSNTPPLLDAALSPDSHAVMPTGSNAFGHPAPVVVDDYTARIGADRLFQTLHGDGHPDEGAPADGRVITTVTETTMTTTGQTSGRSATTVFATSSQPPAQPPSSDDPVSVQTVTDPIAHAIATSQARFPDGTRPDHVVIASSEVFADALAGTPLTADGPLLLTPRSPGLDPAVQAEIDRTLDGTGTVYILGGATAVPSEPAGSYTTRRLSGPSRIETAVAIAQEVQALYGSAAAVLGRAFESPDQAPSAAFADSLTVGGWAAHTGTPVLLTTSEALHPAVEAYLAETRPTGAVAVGGTAAINDQTLAAATQATGSPVGRISGPTRDTTATAIDRDLWGTDAGPDVIVIEGYTDESWTWGLVAAGPSADAAAPLLLATADDIPEPTRQVISNRTGTVTLIGAFTNVQARFLDGIARQLVADRDTQPADPAPTPDPDPAPTPEDPAPAPEPDPEPGPAPAPGSDANGSIAISRVEFDPPGDDLAPGAGEYVELVHTGESTTTPITLDGWYLLDEAINRIDLCAGYTLAPGDTLRVHTGTGTNSPTACFAGRGQAVWNNSGGDTATLYNDQGAYMAMLSYTS